MGIRGLVPGFPKLPETLGDGPSVEPIVDLELLQAWAGEVPSIVWPRVLTPDDGAPASGVDATASPADEVRGDRARVLGAANVEGAFGSADLLSEGPSRVLTFG
jgi:hypothetical protein